MNCFHSFFEGPRLFPHHRTHTRCCQADKPLHSHNCSYYITTASYIPMKLRHHLAGRDKGPFFTDPNKELSTKLMTLILLFRDGNEYCWCLLLFIDTQVPVLKGILLNSFLVLHVVHMKE